MDDMYKKEDFEGSGISEEQKTEIPEHVQYFLELVSNPKTGNIDIAAQLNTSSADMVGQFMKKVITHAELEQLDRINHIINICPNAEPNRQELLQLSDERKQTLTTPQEAETLEKQQGFFSKIFFPKRNVVS